MLPKTKTERHSDICKEINALYARKNHDYGDSFHQTFTEEGMAMPRIRLGDKLARFKSLTKSGVQEVKDESIRDTKILTVILKMIVSSAMMKKMKFTPPF